MATSKDTVYVGCKFPNGIMMQCFVMRKQKINALGIPGQDVEVMASQPDPGWTPIKLHGPAVPFGVAAPYEIKGGYGFTTVPKRAWDQWIQPGQPGPDLLRSKMVIVEDTRESLIAHAKENKNLKSGLEPLKTGIGIKDPRYRKGPLDRKEVEVSMHTTADE